MERLRAKEKQLTEADELASIPLRAELEGVKAERDRIVAERATLEGIIITNTYRNDS
jgi:hypothetical protein